MADQIDGYLSTIRLLKIRVTDLELDKKTMIDEHQDAISALSSTIKLLERENTKMARQLKKAGHPSYK